MLNLGDFEGILRSEMLLDTVSVVKDSNYPALPVIE